VNQDGTPLTLNWRAYTIGSAAPLPAILRRVEPVYTEEARQARIQGTVLMQAVIHEDGSLSITRFVTRLGYGLDESAQAALEQWRFGVPTVGFSAVALSLNIEVNFNLR
jgi:TonB family protein